MTIYDIFCTVTPCIIYHMNEDLWKESRGLILQCEFVISEYRWADHGVGGHGLRAGGRPTGHRSGQTVCRSCHWMVSYYCQVPNICRFRVWGLYNLLTHTGSLWMSWCTLVHKLNIWMSWCTLMYKLNIWMSWCTLVHKLNIWMSWCTLVHKLNIWMSWCTLVHKINVLMHTVA